ncbi:MAG: methyltransferase domain-containing protein [Gammaproteobacteria bacterium]|nr:methyltransferase domain-containing protein [Gammaproteobacteria bacterium]
MKAKANQYMYSTAAEAVEARRLKGLNKLHNPHSLSYLKPYLSSSKSILEFGCGSGYLAADVLSYVNDDTHFIGIDRDPGQVALSAKAVASFSNAKILQLDVLTEFDRIKQLGPFDLIYCRWVLVHLPNPMQFVQKMLGLLSDKGVFVCEECDNRTVEYRPIVTNQLTPTYAKEATKIWSEISKALMAKLNIDLELTSEKMVKLFSQASNGKGDIKVEGQYQIIFHGSEEKRLINDGYHSMAATIHKAYGKALADFMAPFEASMNDDNIEAAFLTENVVSYRK